MQNNEQNLETPNKLQSFFFGQREIFVWENPNNIFDLCAGHVFQALGLVTTYQECDAIYNALAVKHIAQPRVFVNEKQESISISMLNLEGVQHLAKPSRSKVGKAFWHWTTVDLPALAKQAKLNYRTESIDFQNFSFENLFDVRIILDDKGNPWFVAVDVCTVLGYANSRSAVAYHCSSDGVEKFYTIDNKNRQQEVQVINEENLYLLITRSEKSEAKRFNKWVFGEVLPTLRKTGRYEITKPTETLKSALQSLEERFTRLEALFLQFVQDRDVKIQELEKILATVTPKLMDDIPSYLYLDQNQDNGLCKFGKAGEPPARKNQLEYGGSAIKTLSVVKFPATEWAFAWETHFKKVFKHRHKGKEWYALTETEVEILLEMMMLLNKLYDVL